MSARDKEPLRSKVYTADDQHRLAALSGDFNPVHLDPVLARREIFGGVVVHGIHGVLTALDAYCRLLRGRGVTALLLSKLAARFPGPMYLEQTVDIYLVQDPEGKAKLQCKHEDRLVLEVLIEFDIGATPVHSPKPVSRRLRQASAAEPGFADLAGRTGEIELTMDQGLAVEMFPDLTSMLPAATIAEILAVTRVVGMECPGLRSVLSAVSLNSAPKPEAEAVCRYEVSRTDKRFSLVKLSVTGPSLSGSIDAFYRPAPVLQPTVEEVAARLNGTECASQCALIVGGSRGLGEVTAKIVAAAGGRAIITYRNGREDAERIAAEIVAAGLRGEACQMDVLAPEETLAGLRRAGTDLTHVYYFASPKIFVSKGSMFESGLFAQFTACYVDGFYRVYRACRSHWNNTLVFFYPSTVAIDEKAKDLAEYAAAKAAGETLAAQLAQFDRRLSVLVRRLPRIATDQTTTLMPYPAANALDIMLDVVRDLDSSQKPLQAT